MRLLPLLISFSFTIGVLAKSEECKQCEVVVELLHKEWGSNASETDIGNAAKFICVEFQIEDSFVCDLIITEFEPEVVYILGQIIFEPHQLCGLLLQDCGTFFDPFNSTWSISIPGNQPTPTVKQPVPPGKPILRVLHLTDLHVDTQYTVGAEADCGEPMCCRPNQDPIEVTAQRSVKQAAGKWGTVGNCDLPYWTLTNMLQFIQDNHKDIDYIVVSGDLESHAVYDYSKTVHAAMIKNISDAVRSHFPKTPVYFAVGNHEGVPIDNRASYAVQLYPGLRLISINNPLGGDQINFWMYMNQTDPDGTLSWVISELDAAEKAGDKVHIVAHIPGGGSEALEGWALNYYKTVNRYQNTISAQFFGHTHSDNFYMVYEDPNDATSRPTAMVYSAPSATTDSEFFPAYRIYTIDGQHSGSTYQVIDYEQWFLNITEANASDKPVWKQMFSSFNQKFGLGSQVPSEWNNFLNRMKNNDNLFNQFNQVRMRRNQYDGVQQCTGTCKMSLLCDFRQFHHDQKLCSDLPGAENQDRRMIKKKSKFHKKKSMLEVVDAVNRYKSSRKLKRH